MTRVGDIEVTDGPRGGRIRATVQWEPAGAGSDELVYTYPGLSAPEIRAPGDVMLAAALIPAMRLGSPLVVDAPVSARLLAGARVITDICSGWFPSLRRIPIEADITERAEDGTGVGLLFSCGVDSFYSLLTKRPEREAISTLVTIHGYDMKVRDTEGVAEVARRVERVAGELGTKLQFVETNLGEIATRFVPWSQLQGAFLAAGVLGLSSSLRQCHLASSGAYRHLAPWGSHPFLDPLWSTEALEVVHDGAELARHEKVYAIAQNTLALETLRVCNYELCNCRRCSTCLVTMLALHVAGALERCTTLGPRLPMDELRSWRVNYLFLDVLAELADDIRDPDAQREVRLALRRAARRKRFVAPAAELARRSGLRKRTIDLSPLWRRTDSRT